VIASVRALRCDSSSCIVSLVNGLRWKLLVILPSLLMKVHEHSKRASVISLYITFTQHKVHCSPCYCVVAFIMSLIRISCRICTLVYSVVVFSDT